MFVLPKVGDIVRLRQGWTAKEVIGVVPAANSRDDGYRTIRSGYVCKTRYLHSRDEEYNDGEWRRAEDFVPWDGGPLSAEQQRNRRFNPTEKEEPMSQKLYEVVGQENRFGLFLATNSAGQIVLEMKGENGKVEAFAKDAVAEVKPYTYRCKAIAGNRVGRGAPYSHLEGEKGAVKKGDLIVRPSGTIYIVEQAGSNAKPTGKLYGTVIAGKDIPRPGEADTE